MNIPEVIEENTKYKATIEKEFEKSVNLLSDEHIEFKKRGIVFTGRLVLESPGLVVLTNKRLIILTHHFFGPDKLLYIPLTAISKMNFNTLGFLRGAQKAIRLEYDNKSIVFAITYVKKFMTGFGGPKGTTDFFEVLKKKFPDCVVDEYVIPAKNWDYYLFLVGLVIGYMIGGLLPIMLCAASGFFIGKAVNKYIK